MAVGVSMLNRGAAMRERDRQEWRPACVTGRGHTAQNHSWKKIAANHNHIIYLSRLQERRRRGQEALQQPSLFWRDADRDPLRTTVQERLVRGLYWRVTPHSYAYALYAACTMSFGRSRARLGGAAAASARRAPLSNYVSNATLQCLSCRTCIIFWSV